MAELIKNWFLDPIALLFFTSMIVGSCLILLHKGERRENSAVSITGLTLVWLAVFLLSSSPILVNPLITTLEGRLEDNVVCTPGSHIVVLSGGVDSSTKSAQYFEGMSVATKIRATQAWRLASLEPGTRLIVAGGTIGQITEADVVAEYWLSLGIESNRIIRDTRSSNTHENALNVVTLLKDEQVSGAIRLVTSAMHMPRAIRSFENVLGDSELEICPVNVDRQALTQIPLWSWVPQTTALVKFDKWFHEVVALQVYRIRGWI